jgi:PAS domain S-box-containing protein
VLGEDKIAVMTDADGDLRGTVGVVRDITDRKERERELGETRERMRHALDVTDSTIYEIDLDTGMETRHGPFERLFGVPSGEVSTSGAFYDRCVHPDDRERVERIQNECLGNGTDTISFEFRTHPDRGPVRWLYSEGYIDTGPDGELRRLVGLDTDITEHKERERRLRQLKEEYRNVFDNVQDSLFLVNVIRSGDDPEFELRRVNPANADLFDRSPEEIQGKTPEEVFGEETGGGIVANYRRCLDRGEPVSYEEELQLEDGTRVFRTTLTPVEIDGEVARIVGVAHEVTERKRRERDLQR